MLDPDPGQRRGLRERGRGRRSQPDAGNRAESQPASVEAGQQRVLRAGQSAGERAELPPELLRGFRRALAFETAKDERHAERFRQLADFLVDRGQRAIPGGVGDGGAVLFAALPRPVRGAVRRFAALPGLRADPVRHAVQPRREVSGVADLSWRCGAAPGTWPGTRRRLRQSEPVEVSAHGPDQPTVPADELGERRFVPRDETAQLFAVADLDLEVGQASAERSVGNAVSRPPRGRFTEIVSAGCGVLHESGKLGPSQPKKSESRE